jgi:hypothetical protein
MSGRALYRVTVRMLYDPEFAGRVYQDREAALQGEDLTLAERNWLVQPDPRAYRTDGMRRWRSLTALMEEYPAASAFLLRRGTEGAMRPRTEPLDAFFSSPLFHRCLHEGESIVLSFGAYLQMEEHGGFPADPRARHLARLEETIARVRRCPVTLPIDAAGSAAEDHPKRLAPASRVRVLTLPTGTYELHRRISLALEVRGGRVPQALLDYHWSLPILLELTTDVDEYLLVENASAPGTPWTAATVHHAPITPELYSLLRAAEGGTEWTCLEAKARELGAEAGEESSILLGLLAEGVLVAAD